jgi:beta-glucanase (GH16 family)
LRRPILHSFSNVADRYVHTRWDLACFTSDNVAVRDGNLVISTQTVVGELECLGENGPVVFRYSSGWVDTNQKLSVANGLFEIRAKLPPPLFRTWPSSFLIANTSMRDTGTCWPLATEIDLYAVTGLGRNAMCASFHYGRECFVDLGASLTGCLSPAQLTTTEWVTYAADFSGPTIRFYVDGVLYYVIDKNNSPLAPLPAPDSMAIVMQTALAWWIEPRDKISGLDPIVGGPGIVTHEIDWLRLWRHV